MEKLFMQRGFGKTTQLIKISAETGACIVCVNATHIDNIRLKAKELNLEIPFPLTFYEFVNKKFSTSIKGFLIDDADLLVQYIAGKVKVDAISMTP